MVCVTPLRLAVALPGAGRHPGDDDVLDLVREAERGRLDFVTFGAGPASAGVVTRAAAVTTRIGLIAPAGDAGPGGAALGEAAAARTGWLLPGEPPPGRPVVAADRSAVPAVALRAADVVFVRPAGEADTAQVVGEVRAGRDGAGDPPVRIFADLAVLLDDTEAAAVARRERLDAAGGAAAVGAGDIAVFAGTPAALQRRLQAWLRLGLDGFRLHPVALPHDLHGITRGLVPALQENDAFRRGYETRTLAALLGLPR